MHELLLLSPSSNYPLLNGYHNLCAVNYNLFVVYDKHRLVSHWPPASEISTLLIKTFLEVRVDRKKPIAIRSPTGRLSTAALCHGFEKNGMVGTRHGKCESDTAALSKSNGKDTF